MQPEQDRLTLARIAGIVGRHCRTGALNEAERRAAIAELSAEAGGRVDLLAQHAGLALGLSQSLSLGSPDGAAEMLSAQHALEAELCLEAGADESQVPYWAELCRRRAAAPRQRPYTG
jgi:hypothetical protein